MVRPCLASVARGLCFARVSPADCVTEVRRPAHKVPQKSGTRSLRSGSGERGVPRGQPTCAPFPPSDVHDGVHMDRAVLIVEDLHVGIRNGLNFRALHEHHA